MVREPLNELGVSFSQLIAALAARPASATLKLTAVSAVIDNLFANRIACEEC